MKLILLSLVVSANLFAIDCPSNLLVKKYGAKTFYTSDLKTKFSEKELTKFGCVVVPSIMSKEQNISLIDLDAATKKAKLI